MRYIAEYEHIFFDRYVMDDAEKEKWANYIIEKGFSELNVPFVRKGAVFSVNDEVVSSFKALEKLADVLKWEFFIFLESEKAEKKPERDEIERFVAKMYLYEDFTPASITEKFNITRTKLDRYFAGKFSVPAKEYIRDFRVKKAKEHIQRGERLETVAFLTGFGSVKTMTRAFKVSCNATPGQFRAHLTEKL